MLEKKSQIQGTGWGDCHNWYEFKFTPNDNPICRYSTWKCKSCGIYFNHMYNYITNIFKAMEACGVPNYCKRNGRFRTSSRLAHITGVRSADKVKGAVK